MLGAYVSGRRDISAVSAVCGSLCEGSQLPGFSGSDRSEVCSRLVYRACGKQFGLCADRDFKCGPSVIRNVCVNLRGLGGKFLCVDLGGLGSVFICKPERARLLLFHRVILDPRFCGREDVWKGWRTIALYLRFSKQGACCVYYQNIVDFLCRVVKVCLCINLILWKLSESFREIVDFLLCLIDVFLLGILALLVSKLSF